MLKVLLTDDQLIIRRGVKQILLEDFTFVEVTEIATTAEFLERINKESWDIAINDLYLEGMMEALKMVKQLQPSLPVLILTSLAGEQFAMKSLQNGASGYLNKDAAAAELIKAVRQVLSGRKYIPPRLAENGLEENPDRLPHEKLSERELKVFKLLVSGKTVAEIGIILSLQSNTVSTYRSRLLVKMNMRTNADILRYAMEHNLF